MNHVIPGGGSSIHDIRDALAVTVAVSVAGAVVAASRSDVEV